MARARVILMDALVVGYVKYVFAETLARWPEGLHVDDGEAAKVTC